MTKTFLKKSDTGVILKSYVQPGASRDEISGLHGDRLKIRIKSPPVDGKANENLLKFLAKYLKLPLRNLRLLRGEKSREKDLEIIGLSLDEIIKLIDE